MVETMQREKIYTQSCERIVRYAFEYAKEKGKNSIHKREKPMVCFCHSKDITRVSDIEFEMIIDAKVEACKYLKHTMFWYFLIFTET